MEDILNIAQLVIAVALIIVILIQNKGTGLGGAFGGSEGNAYTTKRGFEKKLHYVTIALAILFLGLASTNFFI
jgi:preprotein translocase subunit SecG